MISPSPRRRAIAVALAALLGTSALLAACGDDSTGSGSTTDATSPEDVQAPMAEVLDRLPELLAAGDAAEAAAETGDFETVLSEFEGLHEVWEEVEGTIKATDPDIYEAIETAQGLIKDGGETENADRVATGVADQADAIGSFIEGNG